MPGVMATQATVMVALHLVLSGLHKNGVSTQKIHYQANQA